MTSDLDARALADAGFDRTVDIRRDLHAHPELAFAEERTTRLVRDELRACGWTELRCPTSTGAVAELAGGRPGRTVLLRADIDALPLQEETGLSFASRTDGVMHACGHDGHAAILLGVARALASIQEALPGRVVVVFQPAEETVAGARAMLDGGLLEIVRADVALGLHLTSLMPAGLIGYRAGVSMAGIRPFRLHLRGAGGHAALGTDGNVVLAAAALVPRLASAVAGLDFEGTDAVCAAGVLHAGAQGNVVPREAEIIGSIRTFDAGQEAEAIRRLTAIADEVGSAHRVQVVLEAPPGAPPVDNDPAVTAAVARAAAGVLGSSSVFEMPPVTPSDDVSEILRLIPGVYLTVGARPGPRVPPQHHAPDFAIDEEGLRSGMIALLAGTRALALGE